MTATDSGKTNPFTAADVRSVAEYKLEHINKPTAFVEGELKDAQAELDKAYDLLGEGDKDGRDRLVESGYFGGDLNEANHKIADLNARCGGLREALSHQADEAVWRDAPAPRARAAQIDGYQGPTLVRMLADAARAEGRAPYDFEDRFKTTVVANSLREHPVLNALFERADANPFQRRDPGHLSTVREMPTVLDILPMRDVIGVQNTVKKSAKTVDTQAAASRAEGAAAAESTYQWSGFTFFVRNIATSMPVTDEAMDDDPDAEARVTQDLMGECRIELTKQVMSGDGTGENQLGLGVAATVPTGTILSSYNSPTVPTARKAQDVSYDATDGWLGNALFDDIRNACAEVENDPYMANDFRYQTHLVALPSMLTALGLARHVKAFDEENNVALASSEYVLGGPLRERFSFMPWGLQIVPNNYGFLEAATGDMSGLTGAFNARNAELAIRRDTEIRRGFVDAQFVEFKSTFATQIRAALCIWDGAAFCRLNRQ